MTPEGKVKREIDKILKKLEPKVWYFKPVSNGMGKHGIPDYIICCNGCFVGVEAKAGNGKPTAHQKLQLEMINKANGLGLVVTEKNLEELQDFLLNMIEGTR